MKQCREKCRVLGHNRANENLEAGFSGCWYLVLIRVILDFHGTFTGTASAFSVSVLSGLQGVPNNSVRQGRNSYYDRLAFNST